MDIGTYFNFLSSGAKSTFGINPIGFGGTKSNASSNSLFGPAANVSLNGSRSGRSSSGVLGGVYTPQTNLWQFNLSGVMNAGQGGGVPQTYRTEEQQQADQKNLKQALGLIEGGQFADARALLDGMLEENPTNAAAVQALGLIEQKEQNYEQAEQYFHKAHALDPSAGYDQDGANARTLRGSDNEVYHAAQVKLRSPEYAEEGIRLLINLTNRNPDHTQAHVALAEALLNQGDGDNGLMEYNAAIRVAALEELDPIEKNLAGLVADAPSAPFVRQLLGKVYLKQERWDQALTTLTTAAGLADDPIPYQRDVAKAQIGVGRERLDRGDIAGALAAFERAKELNPTGAEVKAALAEAYVTRAEQNTQRSAYGAAIDDYSKAAQLLNDGTNRGLRERAAHGAYALGLKLERRRIAAGEEIDREVVAFQAAHDFVEDNVTYKRKLADTRNAIGDQLMAEEDYEGAAHAYRRAHDLFEHDVTYKANAIAAFVAHGDERLYNTNYDDAVEAYQEAFAIDKTNYDTRSKLANAYYERGMDHVDLEEYENAGLDFHSALLLFPDNAEYQSKYDIYKVYLD